MKFIVHADGGARGNPGPAAVGVVIEEVKSDKGKVISKTLLTEFGKGIGEATNNVAEYHAVLEGLRNLKSEDKKNITIQFYLDSNLVVQQLNGKFKVKDPTLRNLLMQVRLLEAEAGGSVTYSYIPREQNRRADFLVNRALDASSPTLQ